MYDISSLFGFFSFVSYLSSYPPLSASLYSVYSNTPVWNPPLALILCHSYNLWIFLSLSWRWKACQNGFAQHLEHLLFYGADTSSQNASGNSALHISALYNKASLETDFLLWNYYNHNYDCCFFSTVVNPSFSLPEWSGELYPGSAVQGSK